MKNSINITQEYVETLSTLELRKLAVILLANKKCPTFVLEALINRKYGK